MHSRDNPYNTPGSEPVTNEFIPLRARIFAGIAQGILIAVLTYVAGFLAGYLGLTLIARSFIWPSMLLIKAVQVLHIHTSDEDEALVLAFLAGIPLAIIVYSGCAYLLSSFFRRRKRA
jgi:hypothetical protein